MKRLFVLPVLLIAACTTTQSSAEPPAPASTPPPPTVAAPTALCEVALPDEWRRRVDAAKLTDSGAQAGVAAANADASTVFTKSKDKGLLMISGGKQRQVMQIDEGEFVGADFDGRWLTFGVGHSPGNLARWTAYAWDSHSAGEPFQLEDNSEGRNGPLFYSFVHRGKAAWVRGKDLHLYDLATKQDEVVSKAATSRPVFFGDLMVWHEDASLRAVNALDGTSVTPPAQLTAMGKRDQMAADDHTIVWVTDNQLIGWRAGWPQAQVLAKGLGGQTGGIMDPSVSGDLVTWRAEDSHVTDIRSGSTARTTGPGYWLSIVGGAFTVQLGIQERTPAAVSAAALPPLPGC
ncbi:hypothetical protein FKR81_14935 [Lentzea tibetensis]|uniref:Uncharacterized protein n=1 Tax=Lentzea tibetensis TaxID=2591470 RepID=A0A563EV05_9PSEU|nr:hypothetical protein [Lentzea tibetensis]TWP51499.1 hypothetical protein FKR81_14935 [Lentzea tibetensis]